MTTPMTRRALLRYVGFGSIGLVLAACQPQVVKETVLVETEKIVEKEKVVKETVIVESGAPAPFPETTIRFGYPGWGQQFVDVMVTAFETGQPNVKVALEPVAGDLVEKYMTMATAGTCPEVMWSANAYVPPFAEAKVHLDLKPLAEKDPEDPLTDIIPTMLDECMYKGGWYIVPWAADAPVMYYNKALFKEAGIAEPPLEGFTVDEFVQAGKAITNPDKQTYGTSIPESWCAIYVPWMIGYGGAYFNEDKSKAIFDSPEASAGCQALADLYIKHNVAVPKGTDLGGDPFIMGKVGMAFGNRNTCANIRSVGVKFDWDVCLPPKQPVKHVAGCGTMGPAVYSQAAKTVDVNIAYELCRSIIRPSVQKAFARNYLAIPVLQSLLMDSSWYDLPAPPENRDTFAKIWDIAVGVMQYDQGFHCGTVYMGVISKAMTEAFDEMIVAKPPIPAQQALTKAAKTINDCIANKGQ